LTTPTKAKLKHIKWEDNQSAYKDGDPKKTVPVQFNPQTLKVSFSNNNAGGKQPGGSSVQYVGSGTTRLSVELLFDTTADGSDVRQHTQRVAFYILPDPDSAGGSNTTRTPPGIQFEWGSFVFRGVVDSMEETLDYFSEEGLPLRANVSLSISRQDLEFLSIAKNKGGGAGDPLEPAQSGDSIQALAGRNGKSGDWKCIAAANNIDDPLRLSAGVLINVNACASLSGGVNVSAQGGASALAKASAGAGVSARAAATASVSADASASGSASLGTSLKTGR
jgi:hypothetical protein